MTETLFDLTHDLAVELGIVEEGYATGGSTTTIIDSDQRIEADDHWNGGTAWILMDAAGAGASPENEFSIIEDFVNSSNTVTLQDALTQAVASGDWYAVATTLYPLDQLIRHINRAISKLGPIPIVDKNLTTVSGQTLYDLPDAALNMDIRDVLVATSKNADDPDYVRVPDWGIERTAIGTADKIYIPDRYGSGYTIRIDYVGYHGALRVASDELSETIHKDLVIYQAALNLLLWRKKQPGGSGDKDINELLNYYNSALNEMKMLYGIEREGRKSLLFPVRSTRYASRYPGDRNPR